MCTRNGVLIFANLPLQFFLTNGWYSEAMQVLGECDRQLNSYSGEKAQLLRTFFLVAQVVHLLMAGQVGEKMVTVDHS